MPRKSRLLATMRGAVKVLVVAAGLSAAWGVGVFHGSLSVPEITVVEVARVGVLPKCLDFDETKGVCVRW